MIERNDVLLEMVLRCCCKAAIPEKNAVLVFLSGEVIAIIVKNPRKGEVSPACEHG